MIVPPQLNLNSDLKLRFYLSAPIAQNPVLTAVRQISSSRPVFNMLNNKIYQMWRSAEKGKSGMIIEKCIDL